MALAGKTIVFSGALSVTRAVAAAQATAAGATVGKSVSRTTDILVAAPGAGAKLDAAQSKNVIIWNESQFRAALSGATATPRSLGADAMQYRRGTPFGDDDDDGVDAAEETELRRLEGGRRLGTGDVPPALPTTGGHRLGGGQRDMAGGARAAAARAAEQRASASRAPPTQVAPAPKPAVGQSSTWTCSVCTYANHGGSNCCEMQCGGKRRPASTDEVSIDDSTEEDTPAAPPKRRRQETAADAPIDLT